MIANANALALPFADGIAQMCVTSPPYFGLRDYGTATWTGGNEGCDHAERAARNDVTPEALARRAALYGTGQQDGSKVKAIQYRDTCGKCGARRIDAQIGLEPTPAAYVANIVAASREVWRVLRDDGTYWLNLGDSYASSATGTLGDKMNLRGGTDNQAAGLSRPSKLGFGISQKNLLGIPWRVAFALQDDGWTLRSDVVWNKPNPMPESVTDRPTKSHEYVFLLTKNGGSPLLWRARDTGEWSYAPDLSQVIEISRAVYASDDLSAARGDADVSPQITLIEWQDKAECKSVEPVEPRFVPRWRGFDYLYDADAIAEPNSIDMQRRAALGHTRGMNGKTDASRGDANTLRGVDAMKIEANGRNARSVWTIATQPYSAAHFATFPEELARRCILAGSRPGDIVLDPFSGSGTAARVAIENGRRFIGTELSRDYIALAHRRTTVTMGMQFSAEAVTA